MSTPFTHWEQSKINMQRLKQSKLIGARLNIANGGKMPVDLTTNVKGALLDEISKMIKKTENKDEVDWEYEVAEDECKIVE
jgi:hypothetical protein